MVIVSESRNNSEGSSDPLSNPLRLSQKRVWIAGGRGFIGSRLSRALGREGLSGSVGLGAQLHHFEGDIADRTTVQRSIVASQPHYVVNLAAPVNVRRDPKLQTTMDRTIVGGLRNILSAMEELQANPLLLQCGTCEEYGSIPAPFREESEVGPPVSPYARAKLEATHLALRSGVRVIVARPFLTYGPNQSGEGLIPSAIRAALTATEFKMTLGTHTREFNYVDDIAQDLAALLLCPSAEGQIVNLGCGEEHRVVDVARKAWVLAGGSKEHLLVGGRPERPADIPRLFADISRSRELIGVRPRLSLEEGLRATIAGFRATLSQEDPNEL
jgi:nucleoside-diphosphate-sugar epimerase